MTSSLLQCRNLDVGYTSRTVLQGVSLELDRGEVLGIVGPNGSGKSTLIKTLLGVLEPRAGTVHWEGDPDFGYVPQQDELDTSWPLNVRELVSMGRFPRRAPFQTLHSEDRGQVDRALEDVGVGVDPTRSIRELSGGQLQRVLLARTVASRPDVVMLDEPTSAVDLKGTAEILRTILRLGNEHEWTTVLVSHDLNLAVRMSDRLALLREGELFVGPVEEMMTAERLETVFDIPMNFMSDEDGRQFVLPDFARADPES